MNRIFLALVLLVASCGSQPAPGRVGTDIRFPPLPSSGGGGSIPDGGLPLSQLAVQAGSTVVGRPDGGSGHPIALSPAQVTAMVPAVTASANGLMPFGNFVLSSAQGPNIPDGNVTINPGTDGASFYVMPANTVIGNRIVIVSIAGSPPDNSVMQVAIMPQAHAVSIEGDTGATACTFAVSSSTQVCQLFKSGGHWGGNTQWLGNH